MYFKHFYYFCSRYLIKYHFAVLFYAILNKMAFARKVLPEGC